MKKKFFLISFIMTSFISIIAVLVISNAYRKEMAIEENRMRRYVSSAVALALSVVQDEIIHTFYSISTMLQSLDEKVIGDEIERIISSFGRLSSDFPNIIEYAYFAEFQELIDYQPLFKASFNEGDLFPELYLLETLYSTNRRDVVYIRDMTGFMAYPVDFSSGEGGLVVFGISLEEAIKNFLPGVLKKKLAENKLSADKGDIDFIIAVAKGIKVNSDPVMAGSDLLIDLNYVFNLNKIETYFRYRNNREFQKITSGLFLDNHCHLIVRHKRGNITAYFHEKYIQFVLMEILVAFLFLVLIQLILFSHFISQRTLLKEHQFMSLISHELNTPLSVISLTADNISKGYYNRTKGIEYYGRLILKETQRLSRMIRNILLITNNTYRIDRNDFHWEEISEIIRDLKNKANETLLVQNCRIEFMINTEEKQCFCSRHLLIIALFNVLDNGIRYGAAFSSSRSIVMEISDISRNSSNFLNFRISDSGPGIPKGERKKIFHNFFRGAYAQKGQLPGSGLGLSLTKSIIREHGGTIRLTDNNGVGTSVHISLPMEKMNEKDHAYRR